MSGRPALKRRAVCFHWPVYTKDICVLLGNLLDNAIEFAKENSYSHLSKNIIFAKSIYQGYAGCVGAMKLVSEK